MAWIPHILPKKEWDFIEISYQFNRPHVIERVTYICLMWSSVFIMENVELIPDLEDLDIPELPPSPTEFHKSDIRYFVFFFQIIVSWTVYNGAPTCKIFLCFPVSPWWPFINSGMQSCPLKLKFWLSFFNNRRKPWNNVDVVSPLSTLHPAVKKSSSHGNQMENILTVVDWNYQNNHYSQQ